MIDEKINSGSTMNTCGDCCVSGGGRVILQLSAKNKAEALTALTMVIEFVKGYDSHTAINECITCTNEGDLQS